MRVSSGYRSCDVLWPTAAAPEPTGPVCQATERHFRVKRDRDDLLPSTAMIFRDYHTPAIGPIRDAT